jgi:hypothetical protein
MQVSYGYHIQRFCSKRIRHTGFSILIPVHLFEDLVDVSVGVSWLQLLLQYQAVYFVQHENGLYTLVPGLL